MNPELQNAYLRAKVHSASPEELRLMLLDGALRFTRMAREGIVSNNHEMRFNGFSNARPIVLELAHGIGPETDPELRRKIVGVFMFIYRRLIDANVDRSVEIVDEALRLLEYERETWALYLEKLGVRRPDPGPAAPLARAAAGDAPAPEGGERPSLCIQA